MYRSNRSNARLYSHEQQNVSISFTSHPLSLSLSVLLLRPDVLQLLGRVQEVVGIRLGHNLALLRLLHKVLVALLLSERNRILLALEVDVRALHEIARRLPAHQRVLPPVALFQHVPVHPPFAAVPVARLRSRLCGLVNSKSAQY